MQLRASQCDKPFFQPQLVGIVHIHASGNCDRRQLFRIIVMSLNQEVLMWILSNSNSRWRRKFQYLHIVTILFLKGSVEIQIIKKHTFPPTPHPTTKVRQSWDRSFCMRLSVNKHSCGDWPTKGSNISVIFIPGGAAHCQITKWCVCATAKSSPKYGWNF